MRGALAAACGLVPSLLAGHFLPGPASVALAFVPFSLIEQRWERRGPMLLFLAASALCAAAIVNGVYLEGVLDGGSISSGLSEIAPHVRLAPGAIEAAAVIALIGQCVGLGYTLCAEVVSLERDPPIEGPLEPFVFAPLLMGVEVGLVTGFFHQPAAAPCAAFVFTIIALSVAFAIGSVALLVSLAGDALERRLWPEVA